MASYVCDVCISYCLILIHDVYFTAVNNESDDELSTGAIIAITFVVTFIITFVVTALICIIIINLYYKYRYGLKEKVKVDDDKNDTKQKDPCSGNIAMDTNPAYTSSIKMDTNPAYATTS